MRKRLLSALLAMAMMLTMLPTAAFATGEAVVAGLSADSATAIRDIKEATQKDATNLLKDEEAENLLWFVVTGLTAENKYSISMKNGDKEVLTANAITYLSPNENRIFKAEGTGHLIYVSMDQASEDGATGQVNSTSLGNGAEAAEFTVSISSATGDDGKETVGDVVATTKIKLQKKDGKWVQVVDETQEPEEPAADSIFVAASDGTFAGKKATDLQTGSIAFKAGTGENANKYAVTGVTLKKVEGWTDFNQALEEEQSGYYLAFAVSKTMGGNTVTGMVLTGKDAQGKPTDKTYEGEALNSAFSDNGGKQCDLFIHLGADADAVKAKAPVIKLKYGDASNYTEYTLDLSAVKIEGEVDEYNITVAEAQNGTAKVQVGGKDVTTAAANDEVTVVAAPATGFEVDTITVMQGETKVTVTEGKFTMPAGDVTVTVTFKKTAEEPAERTEKIASTGFEAKGADADKALGVESDPNEGAHCDPNTMWAKFEGLNAEKNYTLTVKKGGAEVYTEASFPGTATKVYFTLDPELVESKPANHSIAKTAIAEGKYEFTLTEAKAQAPAGQAAETEEKPLEAKAELEIRKVTFAAGEGATGAPAAIYAALNGAITLPEAPTTAPTDYTFAGWGVALNEAGKYVVTKSETLTALWKNEKVVAGTEPVEVPADFDAAAKDALEDEKTVADATNLLTDKGVLEQVDVVAKTLTAEKIKELTDKVNAEDGNEGFANVEVKVYLQMEAVAYQAATDEAPASLKVEITPMYKLVATKMVSDDEKVEADIPGETAKELTNKSYNKAADISIVLPANFPEEDLFAKHYESDDTTVKEWLPVTVNETTRVATFKVFSFSQFELAVNADTVTVTYKAASDEDATYTAADINKTPLKVLEDDSEKGTFKGWALTADATSAKYSGTLTEKMLKDMITDKGQEAKLVLYPVFVKSSTNPGGPGGIGGGSSGSATYSVNVPTAEHGTVTVNPRNAAKDATVTITVAPDKGYHLESLTVTDKDGNKIELTKVDATKYTFKMPASRVEVKAVFAEGEAPAISFTDVAEGEYYYDAVLWAVNKGITNGLTDTTFGPNASCTRAQMVTFLWRAAGSPEPTSTTTAFTDIDSNEYYYKAVLWAVEKGITTGTTETTFSPSATVTRAQTVTFLYRYAGTPAVSGNNNFTDLEAGEYYVDAVQWAATNGITTGTTETTFSPANNCTRGQIVTFLYRHIVK